MLHDRENTLLEQPYREKQVTHAYVPGDRGCEYGSKLTYPITREVCLFSHFPKPVAQITAPVPGTP